MKKDIECKYRDEIVEMHTDLKWVKKTVEGIDKSLNGNGQKGMVQRIRGLENWRYYMLGAIATIGVVATYIISILK
jgi:hypothetical protein